MSFCPISLNTVFSNDHCQYESSQPILSICQQRNQQLLEERKAMEAGNSPYEISKRRHKGSEEPPLQHYKAAVLMGPEG
eukprot:1147856-Pelagomonas_calceolata.AAC.10